MSPENAKQNHQTKDDQTAEEASASAQRQRPSSSQRKRPSSGRREARSKPPSRKQKKQQKKQQKRQWESPYAADNRDMMSAIMGGKRAVKSRGGAEAKASRANANIKLRQNANAKASRNGSRKKKDLNNIVVDLNQTLTPDQIKALHSNLAEKRFGSITVC